MAVAVLPRCNEITPFEYPAPRGNSFYRTLANMALTSAAAAGATRLGAHSAQKPRMALASDRRSYLRNAAPTLFECPKVGPTSREN
jgi:hypothetical protein